MLPADEQYITGTSFRAEWTDETDPAGVIGYKLQYSTGDDVQSVSVNNGMNYMLENLVSGATYSYKVRARYIDDSESDWSNIQYVTLPAVPAFEPGDVNQDGRITIADVTALINFLLEGGEWPQSADVDQNGALAIKDVTELINILLTSGE